MRIIVPPDIESALSQQARKEGKAPEEVAVEAPRERFAPAPAPVGSPATLADFLADHIGVLSSREFVSGGARISENTGAKFTEFLVEKREQGKR